MLAMFNSVPQSSRCGTQENSGGGALARCFRLYMVPLCAEYLQNHRACETIRRRI